MTQRAATLLERLSAARTSGGQLSTRGDRAETMRSVMRNLQGILNTRSGSAAAQPDLGTTSPHELLQGFPGTAKATQEAMGKVIERYEPRLRGVKVAIEPDEGRHGEISFRITARLASGDGRDQISFHTAIGADGRIRLSDA